MKKSYLLSLIIALCFTIQCWAEFNPTPGTMYALKEKTSGLYLDIQTLDINEENAGSTIKGVRAYSLTVRYMCGGEELTDLNVSKVVLTGEAYTINKLDGYTISSCQVNGANAELVDGACTFNVNSTTEVVVTLEQDVQDIEATDLYALKCSEGTYFNFTPVTIEYNTTQATFQDNPSFVYKKSDANGVYFQSFEDENKYIGYQTTGAYWITTTAQSYWTISEADNEGLVTISRSIDANSRLGHDDTWSAGTGIFTNVGDKCNTWQLIPAYPITIVYKNGEEEIRTVKAAAMIGKSYEFDIDLNGGTLVSCTADKGNATVKNNRCTIADVNGATTVTVTLTLPTAPFAPEVGKAYVLKVVGTDKYLDIRTLGNDDPNVSGSNNISTSTKPYPIYFEQGQNGTWKMKNANGKYVGLYPGKDWDPVIGASSYDWTMDGSANNFTIARGSGKYINYSSDADADKVAGKPLYCDKGTGLQFQLVDYNDVDFITGAGLGKEGAESPYVSIKEIDAEGTTTSIPIGMGWVLTIEVENPDGASHGEWGSSILATGKEPFPYKDRHNGFQLYLQSGTNGAKKLDVVFGNADHIVNNVNYIGDFSAVITYDGISKLQVKTTNANGVEETNNYNVTLPEISEFAYGLPTGINIKRLAIETIGREYTFAIGETPNDQEVAVTYNGEALAVGDKIVESKLNLDLFGATEIEGYTWNVIADKETNTITLNYTAAEVLDLQAVKDLVNRIGGAGTADKFKFVHAPWLNSKQETFVLGSEDGKILIKGSTISAITTGIGWYLNNIAHINIAWNSLNEKTVSGAAYADLSNLPIPTTEETHTSDAKYRYYLNYCTFGYSMTSWTWKRWQQEIDWMALHGINMPLQIVGLEEVWRKFLSLPKYNYTAEEAKAFVPGPAYTAWWGMNNLQGWGGTGAGDKIQTANDGTICEGTGGVQDDAWYVRQEKLAKQILEAQRALGMQPVLPGFSGMVPSNFTTKTGIATDQNGVEWQSFLRPSILDPTAQKFADVAKDYYTCLKEVMGESEYYSMDPFHEGGEIASGKYSEAYTAIYEAMEAANAGSQWVIQQWHWTENQAKSVNAVPAGRLIVLDLFSDGDPDFDDYGNGYAPQDAVFCAIPNFGGRSGLMGRLQNVTDNYYTYKAKYKTIKGIGAAPEAIEQTPVTYDLIYQLPWMNGLKPDVAAWVDNYAVARYGVDNDVTKEAWSLLRQGPLNYGADAIEGPVEDVWGARPNLNSNAASFWGKTLNTAGTTYTKERRQMLIDAVYKLLSQKDAIGASDVFQSNYNYDLVEFGGGVMADYAYDLLLGIRDAKNASNTALYEARRDAFLALIEDVDAFKGTNLNFRLGKWTQEARAAAAEVENAKSATPDWYEFNNARSLISTWTYKQHGLNDYSYRSWQGLMKDYYLPRWRYYFDNNCTDPASGYFFFEWNWAHGMTHQVGDSQKSTTRLSEGTTGYSYTREPEGNTVDEAQEMLAKYILPVMADGFTYYAYRHLNNDLSDIVTVVAKAGETIDLTPYFGVLNGVESVTGDVVGGTTTDLSGVSINADAADGVHPVTITLNDKTTLVCSISINPRFNGIYTINYKNGDADAAVFIAYNTVPDNSGNIGYKLIATSNAYRTQAEGDKHFLITPSGAGFKISAQGKYLKSPNLNAWNHLLFSDNPAEAGVYLFEVEEEETDVFKMRDPDTGSSKKYVNDYVDLIFGNDPESKENLATFTFKSAKTFPFTMTPAGMATLCLPFNVKMPAGMYAYDFEVTDISDSGETNVYDCVMKVLVRPGEVLKAGAPVIVKALEGDYEMEIVMQDHEAKTNLANSLLKGNFVSQTLTQSETVKKFIFTKPLNSPVGFYRMQDEGGQIGANKCWMEWNVQTLPANAKAFQISFDEATDIEGVSTEKLSEPVIYDLAGRKLKTPQRGFNIVNGKKVIVK